MLYDTSVFIRFKLVLPNAALRADPRRGYLFKRRARLNPTIRIAFFWIIHITAYGTDVFLHAIFLHQCGLARVQWKNTLGIPLKT